MQTRYVLQRSLENPLYREAVCSSQPACLNVGATFVVASQLASAGRQEVRHIVSSAHILNGYSACAPVHNS